MCVCVCPRGASVVVAQCRPACAVTPLTPSPSPSRLSRTRGSGNLSLKRKIRAAASAGRARRAPTCDAREKEESFGLCKGARRDAQRFSTARARAFASGGEREREARRGFAVRVVPDMEQSTVATTPPGHTSPQVTCDANYLGKRVKAHSDLNFTHTHTQWSARESRDVFGRSREKLPTLALVSLGF